LKEAVKEAGKETVKEAVRVKKEAARVKNKAACRCFLPCGLRNTTGSSEESETVEKHRREASEKTSFGKTATGKGLRTLRDENRPGDSGFETPQSLAPESRKRVRIRKPRKIWKPRKPRKA
jgi:hypothetical protein